MVALSRALQVNFKIAYLDGHSSPNRADRLEREVSFVTIQGIDTTESEPIKLLYRYVALRIQHL